MKKRKVKMTTLNQDQLNQVELLYKHYKKTDLTRSEINDFVKSGKIKNPSWLKQDAYKVARGVYSLPVDGNDISSQVKTGDNPTPVSVLPGDVRFKAGNVSLTISNVASRFLVIEFEEAVISI